MARRFTVEAVFRTIDRVTAPVSRIQQRLGRFTRSLEGGLRSVNRLTNRVGRGMRRGFAVASVAVGALAFSLNSLAGEADTLAKQARRIGFDIAALQEYRFVAERAGFATEEFDKALEDMAKRMGEARTGAGALYTFLRRSDRDLLRNLQRTTDMSEAFDLVIDAMRRAEDPMMRAALANAAFGRQGRKMGNISEMSAEQIDKLREAMRENGLITQQMGADAENYNDAILGLRKSLRGFMAGVLLPLAPILTDVADRAREWVNANRDLTAGRVLEWVRNLVANFQQVVKWARRIGIGIVVFVTLTTVLKTLIGVLTVVNLLMAANPIVLTILGVVALSVALAALVYNWEAVRDAVIRFAVDAGLWIVSFGRNWREVAGAVVRFIGQLRDHFVALPTPVKVALAALLGPIGLLLAAAAELTTSWGYFKEFFINLWDGIRAAFAERVDGMLRQIERLQRLARRVGRLFGFSDAGDDELEARARRVAEAEQAAAVSPQERVAHSLEERRSTAELTIRDESGRAEFTRRGSSPGIDFRVTPTGNF